MAKITSKAGKTAWAFTVLMFSLIVLFFVLAWLHQTFGGNAVGRLADWAGKRATGQAYQF